MKMLSKKTLSLSVLTIVGCAGLILGLAGDDEKEPLQVQTESVQRSKIVQQVHATGKIQPRTQVKISADISAKITRLEVKEGDPVKEGQLLVELDSVRSQASVASQEANVLAAQDEVRLAEANMILAESNLKRAKDIFGRKLGSRASLDTAMAAHQVETSRYASALQQVEQAKGQLKQAKYDLSRTRIYSPMSGIISLLKRQEGEIAIGSQFQEDVILSVADLSQMEAIVNVDENDITKVKVGQVVRLEVDALPGESIVGRVSEVATSARLPEMGEVLQKTEFRVKVAVTEGNSRVRPGMTANANILTDTRESALSVPIQSVTMRPAAKLKQAVDNKAAGSKPVVDKDGYTQIVYVVENGVAIARQVKAGIQSEDWIEILDGLKEGDKVVSGSYRAIARDLNDGDAVTLVAQGQVSGG